MSSIRPSAEPTFIRSYYTELLHRPLDQIRRELEDMQQAFASISRVRELLAIRSRREDGARATLPGGALGVELVRVSFAYAEAPVLRDVTLRVALSLSS